MIKKKKPPCESLRRRLPLVARTISDLGDDTATLLSSCIDTNAIRLPSLFHLLSRPNASTSEMLFSMVAHSWGIAHALRCASEFGWDIPKQVLPDSTNVW